MQFEQFIDTLKALGFDKSWLIFLLYCTSLSVNIPPEKLIVLFASFKPQILDWADKITKGNSAKLFLHVVNQRYCTIEYEGSPQDSAFDILEEKFVSKKVIEAVQLLTVDMLAAFKFFLEKMKCHLKESSQS